MKDNYIIATTDMLLTGADPDAVVRGLKVILKKRGHMRLLQSILSGVERNLEAMRPSGQASLTVANEAALHELKAAITPALESLGATAQPSITIDPNIIGGFIAATDEKSIDASYKRKLVNLYRNITK